MKPLLYTLMLATLILFTFYTGKYYAEELTKDQLARVKAAYTAKLNLKDNEILALENDRILREYEKKRKPRTRASVFLLNGTDDLYFAQTPSKAEAFKRVNQGVITAEWKCWK